jgi:hypothetical protein
VGDLKPAARERSAPVGTIVLLILAFLLYAATLGSLSDAQHTDAAGRGLAVAFGALFATALFVVIAILLIAVAVQGEMSLVARVGAFVLVPAALVAIWYAADAYGNRDLSAIWMPALLPPLFVLYAVRARFAPLRKAMREWIANLIVLAVCGVLIGVPLFRQAFPPPRDLAAEARAAAEEQARRDREEQAARESREREQARFAVLGPNSSVGDYLEFQYDRRAEVRDGIRKVKSRQADTIALLKAGRLGDLESLLEWDVDATPEVCAAYGAALATEAAQVDPKTGSNQLGVAIDLERQRPNLEWLTGEKCDLDAPLTLLEKNLRAVADSSRITKFADELAKLRSR